MPQRPTILVYANCQGDELTEMLNRLAPIRAHFHIAHIFLGALDEFLTTPDAQTTLASAAILWEQMSDAATEERPRLASHLPSTIRHLRFPAFTCSTLYPFGASDPRQPGPDALFAYSDIICARLWREMGGATGEMDQVPDATILARYAELSIRMLPDLNRVLDRDILQWRARDQQCDVKMADFMAQSLRHVRLFYTAGRPTWMIMGRVLRQLLALSLDDPALWLTTLRALDRLDHGYRGNDSLSAPIHPEVARRLDLLWYNPAETSRWLGHQWTFDQFVLRCARLLPYLG